MIIALIWVGIGVAFLSVACLMGRLLQRSRERDSKPCRPDLRRGLWSPGSRDGNVYLHRRRVPRRRVR